MTGPGPSCSPPRSIRTTVAAADQLARDPRRTRTGNELVRLLKLEEAEAATLREKLASERPYIVIARGIEPSVAERIRQALPGRADRPVALEAEPERVYPQSGGGPESAWLPIRSASTARTTAEYGIEQAYRRPSPATRGSWSPSAT